MPEKVDIVRWPDKEDGPKMKERSSLEILLQFLRGNGVYQKSGALGSGPGTVVENPSIY
jgi:hypothetical protein